MNQLGPDALDILLHLESADKKLLGVGGELSKDLGEQQWKKRPNRLSKNRWETQDMFLKH